MDEIKNEKVEPQPQKKVEVKKSEPKKHEPILSEREKQAKDRNEVSSEIRKMVLEKKSEADIKKYIESKKGVVRLTATGRIQGYSLNGQFYPYRRR